MADDDQHLILEEAVNVVKTQAFYMKRCLDNHKLMDALKHCSNMICELRTNRLGPTSYYELYIDVCAELRYLELYLYDLHKTGKRVGDLYELVQYAGNILPRLYLLITVGSVFIKTKEAKAKDILRDMVEMCKGVQHPTRGLFLRNYLSQMTKDKLPDEDSEYGGDGGSVADSMEFILQNFTEMNKLWVRMGYPQGGTSRKSKREEERLQLRMLVATNLERLSQLEGIKVDVYATKVLPRVLEQIVSCKDALAQQHLMESLVMVFPDEFHLHTLDKLLEACGELHPSVDIKKIIVGLVDRLARFANASPELVPSHLNMFELFSSHIADVISARKAMPVEDILMLQVSLVNLALQCYLDKVEYVDDALGYCSTVLGQMGIENVESNQKCVKQLVQLLNVPVDTYKNILTVLRLKNYASLFEFLGPSTRRMVAVSIVDSCLKHQAVVAEADLVGRLLDLLSPLVRDDAAAPPAADPPDADEEEEFQEEQVKVAKLIHLFRSDRLDTQFQILVAARKHFGDGGVRRIGHTLVPLAFSSIRLCQRYHAVRDSDPLWEKKVQKVFQYAHQTIGALVKINAPLALRLFLQAAQSADRCGMEDFSLEMMTQAFTIYEENITDSRAQLAAMSLFIGTIQTLRCFSDENMESLTTKTCVHSAKLLKLADRCRAVYMCSHLFWTEATEDGAARGSVRVLECLQKSLKIADKGMQTSMNVSLFVDILNEYLFYFDQRNEEITVKYLNGLIQLIHTNMAQLPRGGEEDSISVHFQNTVDHIRVKQAAARPDGPPYKQIKLSDER